MHLGKFSAAAKEILEILARHQVEVRLNALVAALQSQVNNPQDPAQTTGFRSAYQVFLDQIVSEEIRNAPPLTLQIWEQIGALRFIDHALQQTVASTLATNNITPQLALQELQVLQRAFSAFVQSMKQIDAAFAELKIETDPVAEGEYEFAIAFPRSFVQERIDVLEGELHELNNAIRHFEEIAEQGVGSSRLKIISSTDWQFYLQMTSIVAACVAHAIERIVQLYKGNLEITKLRLEIEKLKVAERSVPEDVLKPLQDFLKGVIKEEIEKIAKDLVETHYKGDPGRKNELQTGVRFAVHYLADRIDRGAVIQIVAQVPKEPEYKDDQGKDLPDKKKKELLDAYAKAKEIVHTVNAQGRALARVESGKAPTLQLEKSEEVQK